MPTSSFEQPNLTASTKTANILSGDINEFVPFNAAVNIYAVSSASNVNLTMLADSDVLVDDKEIINIGTTLNKSDHLIDSFNVAAGSRLALFLRETGAAATTDVLVSVDVQPLGI